ncbi:hypothetical protein [Burkholderia cepacia]|uniref:hypothetical protein n=1 Tax=Burkholderia cepacia TaxID=292 RepID=UPI000754B7EE|nr:hypothetical protein [Burkholderia cepacia]KVH69660.1 hypothetical protein WJ42_32150 [Burkholderia cepacia]KWC57556.1 hypothetical protein WL55_36035 [Burkholderia cepacia]
MEMTKSWFLAVGLPALICLFSFGYALFHAFRRGRTRPTRAARVYWIACASAMVLGTAITIDIARRSPDATALASLGMLIVGVGILGVLVGAVVHAAAWMARHCRRKRTTS